MPTWTDFKDKYISKKEYTLSYFCITKKFLKFEEKMK